ncbi:conserved hypothetical protein [Histoplasma capsulatum var. duboisii H88]|uniref:Rhodopsin domain-containing protein n=2 Tax=Ajellomyces capsulatus TaxID=5037 RepID=F0UFT6_AJEC8|nr:conserved hypothetical protein [Histoplasma capsulatum H143]EGC44193.1 conserved hypothetical protein [Histoplasma capsulatum var. duboisii H88]
MSSVLGGAPPGTDLTENRNREFNASVATVYGLAVISVALRFFTRVKVQNFTVKADDWLILVSLASVTCSFALAISGGQYGLGKHVWIVPLSDVMVLIKVQDAKSGSCRFQPHIFYLGNAAANVATDVLILLVPIPLVWKLQMPTSKKFLVSSLFLLGTFVCVVSIIRIKFMGELARAKDVTFILVNIFLWSFVEPCIGIVCACLPTLRPLLQKVSRVLFGTEFGKSFSSGPGISPGLVRTQQSTTVDGTKKQKNGFQRMKGAVGEKPESGNGRMRLRPTEDETALTTVSAQFEMDDFRRNGASDADSESQNQSSGIRVKTDFGWQEDVQ